MSRGRRRGTPRGARRPEPVDPHAPIEGQLELFGEDREAVGDQQPDHRQPQAAGEVSTR